MKKEKKEPYRDAPKCKCELKNECVSDVQFKMKNDPRVMRVGKFLRAASLDKTTQTINVLFNDMSIAGPRSCVYSEQISLPYDRLQVYTKRLNQRLCLLFKPEFAGLILVAG